MAKDSAIDPGDIFLAILAAGQSKRFGDADKLSALLNGKMLGTHTSDMLAQFDFAEAWVVTRSLDHPCTALWQSAGYKVVVNSEADEGMAASIRMAARGASQLGAAGLMIVLADMPMVSAAHIESILRDFDRKCEHAVVASTEGTHRCPPVLFGRGWFETLMDVSGDTGARQLFKDAKLVSAEAKELLDVDTVADLQALIGS